MARLLLVSEQNSNKRGGIGNAAMGGVFKSIYLTQGRNSQSQAAMRKIFIFLVKHFM
jgi:hypothetical protein